MKWSEPKKEPFTNGSYRITARKNGYKAVVSYVGYEDYFYFLVEKSDRAFNSLWEKKAYRTEDVCKNACEKWIDSTSVERRARTNDPQSSKNR